MEGGVACQAERPVPVDGRHLCESVAPARWTSPHVLAAARVLDQGAKRHFSLEACSSASSRAAKGFLARWWSGSCAGRCSASWMAAPSWPRPVALVFHKADARVHKPRNISTRSSTPTIAASSARRARQRRRKPGIRAQVDGRDLTASAGPSAASSGSLPFTTGERGRFRPRGDRATPLPTTRAARGERAAPACPR